MLIDFGSVEKARMNVNELKGSAKMDVQEEAEVTSTPAFRPPEIFDLGGIFGDIVVDERVDVWVSLVLFFTSSATSASASPTPFPNIFPAVSGMYIIHNVLLHESF